MLQSQLAQQLGQMAQPSGAQKDLAMAASASQAAGNLTWICTAMKKSGILTQNQVNVLHNHLYKAFWKRPFKFIGYFLFGRLLVHLAESVGTSWRAWKPEFYDYVISEPDPAKAVDRYEESFWNLFRVVKMRLGEKVYGA